MKKFNILFALFLTSQSYASLDDKIYQLPSVDIAAEKSKSLDDFKGPVKFGVNTYMDDINVIDGKASNGSWQSINKTKSKWTFKVYAPNATSLDFGFSKFYLPPTAELRVINNDGTIIRGPFTGSVNKKHGYFWPGIVPGDFATIEITVDNRFKKYLNFEIFDIPRGFDKFWEKPIGNKSLACNIDVNCSEGDPWESQINSVARYNFTVNGGQFLCTGQLINNTAQDGKPYFLTANHCGYESANTQNQKDAIAASMNIWWNYQSQSCRAPGSNQSGTVLSLSGFNDTQSGATHIANNATSDFALVELNQPPNQSYNTELTGWDRRDVAPNSAVSIHHPKGHAKRIALENSPLTITSPGSISRTHLTVNVWDEGLTEQGSSGGGLWNSDGLLVGQLHFGDLAELCTDPVSDSYGRLFTSWDQGFSPQTRLKDWLDPLNTGQMTLQGSGGCEAPSVAITNNTSNTTGETLTFQSQVSGGAGGYSYQWDINGDAYVDGNDANIDVRYAEQYVGNITLTVTDSAGCVGSATQAVVIEAADVQLQQVQNIRQNLDQVCGNNDNVIDPGERWKTLLNVQNEGSQSATDAYLALSVAKTAVSDALSDDYGNTTTSCDRLFIDITNTGTLYDWIDGNTSDNYPADDEGHTSPIQLSSSIDHFGENVSSLVAASNGFFSTSNDATGVDWDNDCPLPQAPNRDNVGARISPLHDDMRSSRFYHQYFSSCPRPAETGTDLACEVFLWKGADLWAENDNSTENLDIQAILYPATSQWVYQYAGTGFANLTATTGMQNSQGSDGITYACNTANSVNTNEAVCIFNKNHQPPSSGAGFVKLDTPVLQLGDLQPNQNQTKELIFSIDTDASCGASFAINHDASVYDEGFNPGQNNVFSDTIGSNSQCSTVTTCGVDGNHNDVNPRDGLWWNPVRSGNGIDLHVTDQSAMLYVMYTGNKDRSPIWYIAQNNQDSAYNQYYNKLVEVNYQNGFGVGNTQTQTAVGWSYTTFIDNKQAIQVREIKGELFAEKMVMQQFAADETPDNHTGHYFSPAESGWGQSVITLDETRVVVSYIYDVEGKPFWTIGSGMNIESDKTVFTAESFCPSCPAVPMIAHPIGTMRQSFNGQIDGTIHEYQIEYPQGSNQPKAVWNKSNLAIYNLVPEDN
jgi:lysyl endopeptidase